MQFRIYAMYGKNRKIQVFMACCFAGSVAISLTIISKVMVSEHCTFSSVNGSYQFADFDN